MVGYFRLAQPGRAQVLLAVEPGGVVVVVAQEARAVAIDGRALGSIIASFA